MPQPIESPTADRDWDAENDEDILASANEIMGDPIRLNKAKVAAASMAAERREHVKALMNAAGRSFSQTYGGFEINAGQSSID